MIIVFLGPPGVGKGTQCRRLASSLQIAHLSTGDMLRQIMASSDPRAETIRQRISAGQLVPDELVLELVEERLAGEACRNGCIFDGFPRNIHQAHQLDELLAQRGTPLDVVICLQADEPILVERLLKRAKLENRPDDTLQTVRARLQVYQAETAPLVDYYRRRGVLAVVQSEGSPDEVYRRIVETIRRQAPQIAPSIFAGDKE